MKAGSTSGFSVVELTFGILAAAILALTVGAMLSYGYSGWKRCNEEAEVQRLGAVAARNLDWTLRGARRSGMILTNSSAVVFQMTNDVWARFYQEGASVRYDADIGSAGTDSYVISNRLVSTGGFQCVASGVNAVSISLRLADGVTQQIDMVVFPRN